MAAIENRGTWTDLIKGVGLEFMEVFDQAMEEYRPGISSLLTVTTGEGAEKHFTGKTGVGRLERFIDGDNVPGGNRYRTYNTDVAYTNYGKLLDVTKNAIEDRDYASELDEMKDLSIGANFSMDESGIQIFNGGFTTTAVVNDYEITRYGDGVPTFSTQHPTVVPGASSQSNASATGIVFSVDNLETGQLALKRQQTDDGLPISLLGKTTVVVAPANEREAQVVTMSEKVSGSDYNDINTYKGNTDMVSTLFLDGVNGGSDTAWFVTVPGRNKMYQETRQPASMDMDTNIKNKVVTFTVDARWANYNKDWRRSWGSKGDAQAYSS